MADRGRDIKFSILSDVSMFDVSKVSTDLETLGRAAQGAGRKLETSVGSHSQTTAREVATAFDQIAAAPTRSGPVMSRNASRAMGGVRRVFKREGKAAAADLASAIGASDSLAGAASNVAATVPFLFGPIGAIIGGLLAGGVATFTAAWAKARAQVQKDAQTMFDALVAGQGRLDQAFIKSKIKDITAPGGPYDALAKQAREAGVSINDLVLAHAGDEAALARVNAQLNTNERSITTHRAATEADKEAQEAAVLPIAKVRDGLHEQSAAAAAGKRAWDHYADSVNTPLHPEIATEKARRDAQNLIAGIKRDFSTPVTIKFRVDAAAARAQALRIHEEIRNMQ